MERIYGWMKKNYEKLEFEQQYDDENETVIAISTPEGSDMRLIQISAVSGNMVVFTTGTDVTVNSMDVSDVIGKIVKLNTGLVSGCFELSTDDDGNRVYFRNTLCAYVEDLVTFNTFKRHVTTGFSMMQKHAAEFSPKSNKNDNTQTTEMYR